VSGRRSRRRSRVGTKRRRRLQRELAGNRYELACGIAALKNENSADLGVSRRAGSRQQPRSNGSSTGGERAEVKTSAYSRTGSRVCMLYD
jgi:hypothetical protein